MQSTDVDEDIEYVLSIMDELTQELIKEGRETEHYIIIPIELPYGLLGITSPFFSRASHPGTV